MNSYDEAKQIVDNLPTRNLYKEHLLEKAGVLATLALADAVKGAGEVREVQATPDIVYGLVSKRGGDLDGSWHTASLYVDHEKAKEVLKDLQSSPQGFEWSIQPYKLNN